MKKGRQETAGKVEIHGQCDNKFLAVKKAFASNFDAGLEVGAAFAATINGKFVVDLWGGYSDEARTKPWQDDTIVCVWSNTKIMTSICALILIDRGLLDPDAPVAKYWPEFAQSGKESVLIRHIMSHTSGLPEFERPVPPIPMETMYDWNKVVKILASQKTLWEPGKDWAYHELTQGFLVGEVVRRITGKTLGTFFRDEVAVPIGADFYIGLPEKHEKRVGQITPLPELKLGELGHMPPDVQAEQAKYFPSLPALATRNRAFRAAEIPAANGHGNARSIARIISTFTCDGELDGIRFFGSPTIQKALQEQYYGTPKSWGTPIRFGLGFGLNSKELPIGPNNRVLYWAGWGGSLSVMDLDAKLSFSYVMNKMEADPKPRLVPIIGALYQSLYS